MTDARHLASAVERSEAQLRGLLAVMPEGVVMHDASGAIITSNVAAGRILGLTVDQLHGRTSMDPRWHAVREDGTPFPGDEHPAMVTLRTGQACTRVTMGVHKPDGTLTWIAVSAQRLVPDDATAGVVATFVDITTYHQTILDLRRDRATLEQALSGSGDGTYEVDLPTGRVDSSDRWARMFGYEPSEIEPTITACQHLLHPDDAPTAMLLFEEMLAGTTERYEAEVRMRHEDGRWLWTIVRGSVVARDAQGAPLRVAGTCTDITSRRQLEAKLRAELVEKERELSGLRALALLPPVILTCMYCRKIRDDQDRWESLDRYITQHTGTRFSHGLCAPCMETHFPEK